MMETLLLLRCQRTNVRAICDVLLQRLLPTLESCENAGSALESCERDESRVRCLPISNSVYVYVYVTGLAEDSIR